MLYDAAWLAALHDGIREHGHEPTSPPACKAAGCSHGRGRDCFMDHGCPYCGAVIEEGEYVDIGMGCQQVSPDHCPDCQAVQVGPYDERELTEEEEKRGWYEPEPPPETARGFFNPVTLSAKIAAKSISDLILLK